jgi:preprotein translocase subunit SecA
MIASMPVLPAICDTCLAVWTPNAINIGNASNIHISDVAVSPCPNCGGVGHIPDGIYSATTDTISVVATTAKSAQSLATLLRILQRARDQQATAEELAKSLEQEQATDLKPVAELVRRLPRKLDIKYWLGIAIAVVALLEGQATDHKVDVIDAQVEQIYAQVIAQHPTAPPTPMPASTASQRPFPKVGRNAPCPCGSGKKYKRCHGG